MKQERFGIADALCFLIVGFIALTVFAVKLAFVFLPLYVLYKIATILAGM